MIVIKSIGALVHRLSRACHVVRFPYVYVSPRCVNILPIASCYCDNLLVTGLFQIPLDKAIPHNHGYLHFLQQSCIPRSISGHHMHGNT